MLTPGAINVPSAGKSTSRRQNVAHVLIDKDGSSASRRRRRTDRDAQELAWRPPAGKPASPRTAPSDQADKGLPYETVVKAMGAVQGRRQARGLRRQVLFRQLTSGCRPPARN
jgi:biopolymer transport protein TolR